MDNSIQTLKLLKNSLLREETISINDQNSYLYHLELKKMKTVRIFIFTYNFILKAILKNLRFLALG